MMDLALPRAARDLDGAVAALLGETATAGGTVGVVGFCMGGQLALLAGTRNRRIGAVVDCYGIHPNVTLEWKDLAAPVLGVFAEQDAFVPPEAVVASSRPSCAPRASAAASRSSPASATPS